MAQYIYGRNAVRSLVSHPSTVNELYVFEAYRNDPLTEFASKQGLKPIFVSKQQLTKLTGNDKHQGFVAKAEEYKTYTLNELINTASKPYPLLIILDGLEDPHNLGAIMRSADAVNADGIIYAKNRSVALSPTVAKVSTGAIDTVKVAEVTNLATTIETLKKQGYWIVCATDSNAQDYRSVDYLCPIALIIGSEGFGVSRLLKEKSDFRVGLPMYGQVNSLNASVAAGILMYQITSQRFPLQKETNYGKGRDSR